MKNNHACMCKMKMGFSVVIYGNMTTEQGPALDPGNSYREN